MNKFKEVNSDTVFIEGIFNYCDRWCEKCQLSSHCMVYKMSFKASKTDAENENLEFWEKLADNLKDTLDILKQIAFEQGIDIYKTDLEDNVESATESGIKHDFPDLTASAQNYAVMVDKWFSKERNHIQLKENEFKKRLFQAPNSKQELVGSEIKEAMDIILWYQYQILAKLERSISKNDFEEENEIQNDKNGSAKVALISIDRSICAWEKLRSHFPEKTDDIIDIFVQLERIKKLTLKYFPSAMEFKRPGFDK
jgi:hypothetical protein